MADKTGLGALKGAPLVAAITSVCASSFLLFGYDQGVMSGVVISEYWLEAMGHPSTVMTGTITALYDIGAVFGAIGAALTIERLGRKGGLLIGAGFIVIGAMLMGCCVERIQMIVGRIVTGLVGIQFMQQTSGINIVTYYAPTLLKSSLGMAQERTLFVSCFLQWYMIDAVGRRRLYITMSLGMCVVLVCEAVAVAIDNQQSAIAAVFFISAFEACFTWGWMATVWVYPAEILPLKIRSKGAALAAAADFLGNFLVVEITPPALEIIGYKTYIIFAVFNLVTAIIVWCFYPETSYLNLESVDLLFLPDEDRDQEIVSKQTFLQKSLQWSVVPRARMAVNEAKARQKAGRDLIASEILADHVTDGLKKELASDHVERRD
ncbi:hypothetical protein PENANT_c010G02263 [Penicillium antarcticum]|uniref:Major facilitator superfamily (MFS) profile domain-containing protein n=1 Tax=Penicillium antarcticum TaxID=416450 RepID=A0A1V6Q822_9EURO|nr:hypothetical protein PENANT_c010G02263 [Penicillium antarcticum]